MKNAILAFFLLVILVYLGRHINPFSSSMFVFHDQTQPARVQQFAKNIVNLHLPPRIAPDFNFGLGYPVFNFYAPTAYWITSGFNIVGLDVINALKLSFLSALIIAFISTVWFLNNFFAFFPSVIGAIIYVTCLYFPLNIFVRGNLAEVWFLSLAPLSFHLLYRQSTRSDQKIFLTTTLVLSAALTSHNLLSPVLLPMIVAFIVLLKNKKRNFISLILAGIISAYFWIPVIFESHLVWAKTIAEQTNFRDHFLCINQLWQSPWGFGGSAPGCSADGMSFMIGKPQIVFFFLGFITYIHNVLLKKTKLILTTSYWLLTTSLFLFLTTNLSQPLWELFSSLVSVIQFPWRLIAVSILGISFVSASFFQQITIEAKNLIIICLGLLIIYINGRYFYGQNITGRDFEKKYLSTTYLQQTVAYKIPEYLPRTVNYQYWRSFEGKLPNPQQIKTLSSTPFTLKQTPIEIFANSITIIGFMTLILFLNKNIWKLIN